MVEQYDEITRLLRLWQAGDREAEAAAFELVLPHLRRMAARKLYTERAGHTLQPTALVNEAFLRLTRSKKPIDWQDRRHFFAVAGRVMRRFLIDYVRRRPKVDLVPIDSIPETLLAGRTKLEVVLQMDELLRQLEQTHPEWCKVVELKFFLRLTDEEAAEALDEPLRTVQRQLYKARHWLYKQLESKPHAQNDEAPLPPAASQA